MAAVQPSPLAAVLPLVFFVLRCSSSSPLCPESCTCQGAPLLLLNCSSSGLSAAPRRVQDSVTELDLSHNLLSSVTLHQPHHNLRNVRLGNNSIAHLSLCVERNLKDRYLRRRWGTRSRTRCLVWAPALQLLSAERNLLEQLPEGLDGVTSLQVLQLSFNRISALHPGMFIHLRQLRELHLQHNLITYLHPQMFQDLDQLRILDLSFNMLTSLHPLTYLTWSNIGADVKLGGNKWQCDCSMRNLWRRMAYDSGRGFQTWNIECAFPSTISGRDLLQLDEKDLNCSSTERSPVLHQDVTVNSGSEILLSCSAQDSMWWTPSGQASVSKDNAGLLISNVSEKDTGLYVCVSAEDQVMSVFNLQINKRGGARKARSSPRIQSQILPEDTLNRIGEEKTVRATQPDLALAVCLSVFITFLVAFILGVLARPCIDVLWRRITKKKNPSAANSVSSAEQRQYDNEAFSNAEDPEERGPFRERRVTFSTVDFIEDSNVRYYDTVASGDQDSISSDAVIEGQEAEGELCQQTTGDSGSKHLKPSSSEDRLSDSGSGESNEQGTRNMEFEHIPDSSELGERRSLSSRSDSSLSEKMSEEDQITEREHMNPKSPQLAEVLLQQRPDFLQDNEELFEFSDSAQSPTVRSSSRIDSFNNLKQTQAPTSDKQKIEDMSSSSSYISEDEPTHYTVNSDQETDQSDNFGVQIKSSYDTKRPTVRPHLSLSSDSSDSDKEPMQNKRKPKTMKERNEKYMCDKTKLSSRIVTAKTDFGEKETPMLVPPTHSFSSSSESEEEITDPKAGHHRSRIGQTVTVEPGNKWPVVDLGKMTRFKRRLDIKAPSPSSDSSSGSESENETTGHIQKWDQDELHVTKSPIKVSQTVTKEPENKWPSVDLGQRTQIKRRLDIKALSPRSEASSSSESEDDTTGHIQEQEKSDLQMTIPSINVSQTMTKEPENQWVTVDLGQITGLKRRLDIKAPSASSDSSLSSDSEDETTVHIQKQEQSELQIKRPSTKISQTVRKEPENQWPTVDLGQVTQIKRRLDIKSPSAKIDLSSSSESEEETTGHIKKQEQNELQMTMPSTEVSQAVTKEPENRWPTVDLGQMTLIKRRIDIKAPSPSTDSSASSESEEETGFIKKQKQEEFQMSRPSIKVTQSVTKESENKWPTVELDRITQIKRRLDIRAPSTSSDSSSISDSEDETTGHIQKQEQGDLQIKKPSTKVSQTVSKEPENQWPTVDLGHVTQIKRRLDIKAPSASIDSSSSSESEDDSICFIEKQEQEELHIVKPPTKVSQTVPKAPENQWPTVDLGQITQIKRRLDFKAPLTSSDSSSNNDAVYETVDDVKKQEQEKLHIVRPPTKVSQTVPKAPENQWPIVDLGQITQIKRRLDFKAPSRSIDSSANNDAVYETVDDIKKQEQEELHVVKPPTKVSQTVTKAPENQWPTVDLGQITQIKRRLDFKAPLPSSDSSSNNDAVYETVDDIKKQEQEKLHIVRPPTKVSQTVPKAPENQWPTVDLGQITQIKRRLDFKAPSRSIDSSANNDAVYETVDDIKKQEQEELHTVRPPTTVSQTVTKAPENQWPTVDLGQITQIKRRLDFKAPSSSPSTDSSKNYAVYETIDDVKKQEQEDLYIVRPPNKVSQTLTKAPVNQWPTVDLGKITQIKRRLDFKAPSPSSDSSSNNYAVYETVDDIKKQEQEELHMIRPPIKVSQTVTKAAENQWPTVDLGQITQIKRRLDFKAPSPGADSSSSSESEEDTTGQGHIKKQEQEELHMIRLPVKVTQTVTKEQENQWPTVDLGQITQIKRRLDFKALPPSIDSSFKNNAIYEATGHIKKQEQEELHIVRPPTKVPQTVSKGPENQWPTVDLGQITQIKRRLDFKAPSPSIDSPSNNEAAYETTDDVRKQGQEELHIVRPPTKVSQTVPKAPENQWPTVDLGQITQIKRRLDFKAPSRSIDSSSKKDAVYETVDDIKKQEQKKLHLIRPQTTVSQTVTKAPENQRPTVDLGQITQIKRRLDFKAPSPSIDSPCNNDAAYETIDDVRKQKLEELHMIRPPVKVTQTVTKAPENQWPTVDLGQITQIKRRLDFKAPSPSIDSSFKNDAVYEATGHIKKQEQEELHIVRPSTKVSQTVTKAPENQWPALDLGQITQIKRRLDFKAPLPSSDSSSNNDAVYETVDDVRKQEQEALHMIRPPVKVTQTVTKAPENQWPTVDLGQTQIKRRLDFKAPSPSSDSSSNNYAVYETVDDERKQEQEALHMIRPPTKVSQTVTKAAENQWPTVDLGQITQIKRRLDFKAPPPSIDSSFKNNAIYEATGHIKKQEQEELHIVRPSTKVSQTVTKAPENQWPALDLGQITQIKRRLDFKAPLPSSDLSSNNDAVYETVDDVRKQEQEALHMIRPPVKVTQTVTKAPENQWPTVDLGQTQIKRRLDFKAPSPSSDSSSNNYAVYETADDERKQEQEALHMIRPPTKVSQTVTKAAENQWPTVDLGQITQIKRRLDIKTQSSPYLLILNSENTSYKLKENIEPHKLNPSYYSRSSDDQDEGIDNFHELTPSSEPDLDSKWPIVDFRSNLNIKRRLNIKVHYPPESPSSNNDSDSMTVNLPMTSEGERTHVGFIPRISRRIDIKALSPQPYQSFSSTTFGSIKPVSPFFKNQSENDNKDLKAQVRTETSALLTTSEKTFLRSPEVTVNISHPSKKDHNIKLEKYTVVSDNLENKTKDDVISTTPEITPELQTRWATMNLGISRFRKRLEITSPTTKAPSLPSPSPSDSLYSSSSESGPGRKPRLRRRIVEMEESVHTDSSPIPENMSVNVSPTLIDLHNKFSYSDEVKPSVTEEKTKPDAILADSGSQRIKRYEDIWVDEQASATTLWHHPYSYHSSGSKEEKTDQSVPDLSLGIPRIKRRLDIKAPSLEPSNSPSFFSKSENDVPEYSESSQTATIGTTAESLITYKRSIIKASSLPRNSLAPIGWSQTVNPTATAQEAEGDKNSSLVSRFEPSMSLDDIIKRKIRQSRSNTDVDLLHDIRWTGIGRHLSDLSTSKPEDENTVLTSLQQTPLTESPSLPLYSSNITSVTDEMKASGKPDVTPVSKYSSLGTEVIPLSSSDTLDTFGISPHKTSETSMTVSEDRKERRGLNALKAMSLERRMWQTDFDKDPSALSDDDGPQDDTNLNSSQFEKDTKVHSNEPLKHLPPASVEKKKDGDLLLMLYGVPRYKRHGIREPTQEAPPPVPETPPPDD